MKGVLLSFKDFKYSTHNMYGLSSGAIGTEALLGGPTPIVKEMRKAFLYKRSEDFVHCIGESDGFIVGEVPGIVLDLFY